MSCEPDILGRGGDKGPMGREEIRRTMMGDLKDGPENFMTLFAFVCGVLGVFHLVAEFQEGVFDVVEAVRWGFAVARGAYWRHLDWSLWSRLMERLL